jgi:F5/8 type C domain
MSRRRAIPLVLLLLAACSAELVLETTTLTRITPATLTTTTRPAATTTRATLPLPPDLAGNLTWFAPLPPMPTDAGRPFTGSDDFMGLFTPDAPWPAAASQLDVFKLYGEWVAYHATPDQLRTAVGAIRDRGLALAVEAGPLDPPPECGNGIEGFAGRDEGALIANRIIQAGGRIDLIALDEPLYFASIYEGGQACGWEPAMVAAEVGEFVNVMRGFFPDALIGDIEPTPSPTTVGTYTAWLETFRQVNGYDPAFLHLDIDWSRDDWPVMAREIVGFGAELGVPIGIIYTGNHSDPDDATWLAIAGERVKEFEEVSGQAPPHVVFQSWMDHPDQALPENDPGTFTNLVVTYFDDPAALGFSTDQQAANIALGRPVTASATEPGAGAERVVDGDAGTHWSAGADPTQWIEITLDGPSTVTSVRLTPAQFPAGDTAHRILGVVGGGLVELDTFSGPTSDGVPIIRTPTSPWEGVETLRVETVASPSWVAWYEIEVFAD